MRRLRLSTVWALLGGLIFTASVSAAQQLNCPPMPDKITQVNHDVRSEVEADVGSLGKLKAGHVGVKTDVVAKNLFDKYPNTDRIIVVQMMAATYCSMISGSKTLKDPEKLSLWSEFSERIFKFTDPSYNPIPTTSKPKDQSKAASKDSPVRNQDPRSSARITPPQKTGDYYIDNVLEKISGGERNPNWSDGERSSALEGLFERGAFSCASTESWPEMLWAVAATRIVIEDNIPAFGQHPETKNHLNEAAGVLLKMEKDIASLWGEAFDPTAAMHNYFRNHDEFIHHLPGMVSTPDEGLQAKRRQNVNALRKALKGYIPIAADSSCDESRPESNPGAPKDSNPPKLQSEQHPANPNRPATELATNTDEKNAPPTPVTANQKTESATTGSANPTEGTKAEAAQSAKPTNPSDQTTESAGSLPQTPSDLLRQIEEMLEKDRELSDLKGCPTADSVHLHIVGGKISYYKCIEICFASWVNVDPKGLDFGQTNVSQDEDPDLASVGIPCRAGLYCARTIKGSVGPFSIGTVCSKKKTSPDLSPYFVMDVHAKNADAIADLWKKFARAGF
jgi:hypothetical protein